MSETANSFEKKQVFTDYFDLMMDEAAQAQTKAETPKQVEVQHNTADKSEQDELLSDYDFRDDKQSVPVVGVKLFKHLAKVRTSLSEDGIGYIKYDKYSPSKKEVVLANKPEIWCKVIKDGEPTMMKFNTNILCENIVEATEQYEEHIRQRVYDSVGGYDDICAQAAANERDNPDYFNC